MKDRVLEVMIEEKCGSRECFAWDVPIRTRRNVDGMIFVNADVPLMSRRFLPCPRKREHSNYDFDRRVG